MIGTFDSDEEDMIKKIPNKQPEKNILGFATILNMFDLIKKNVGQEISNYIIEKSKNYNDKHDDFVKVLNENTIGLFINERIVNLSPKLVPILHKQLIEDINWIKSESKGITKFNFDYILCISK